EDGIRDFHVTGVQTCALPILLGAVAGMYVFGFSLNIITLLALVLATGLVVDDAIVVLENIVRRKHLGAGPRAAAVLGTKEVFFEIGRASCRERAENSVRDGAM